MHIKLAAGLRIEVEDSFVEIIVAIYGKWVLIKNKG